MARKTKQAWPVLKKYDADHLQHVALPVGGLGTGSVSLGGRGELRDWELMNVPGKFFVPRAHGIGPMLTLWCKPKGGRAQSRLLEGPIAESLYQGSHGCPEPNAGLPRFGEASFETAYPFGAVALADRSVPVTARVEAFNPMIPANDEDSGLPIAVLRVVLTNRKRVPVDASVCMSLPNFIGMDGSAKAADWCGYLQDEGARGNVNTWRESAGWRGLYMHSQGVDEHHPAWGSMAIATRARAGVTHRTGWAELTWGDSLLDFWDDWSDDGKLENREHKESPTPIGSLAQRVKLPARGSAEVTLLLAWRFPNRMTWSAQALPGEDQGGGDEACCEGGACDTVSLNVDQKKQGDKPAGWVGNHYCTRFKDAWDVVEKVGPRLDALEAQTVEFVGSFCESDLPEVVKEAALFNTSTLRSQTCFRTADGRFYGFEGCSNSRGCCPGSCNHVWNYELTTPYLFGHLARTMREVEFNHATDNQGLMSFRVNLPLGVAKPLGAAAADGQMGCIVKLYREWKLAGDDALLAELWPKARKALEFAWIPGGWDGDQDGVMEGSQHNTMDVEYFGPNGQMQGWYLAALRAAAHMARHLGEVDFADRCDALFAAGQRYMDEQLFNGEYYEQKIQPPMKWENVAPGLRLNMGTQDPTNPQLQLGPACLIDQLVGQTLAAACGLGQLHKPTNIRKTLRSIWKHNRRTSFLGHFNHFRTFALGDEAALLMATFPRGNRPNRPFPYANEVMTGFEYTAAVHMLYEGLEKQGLQAIADIRDRYDGRKRNPFNEAECGHHYARAMAAWGAVLALTGFDYDGRTGELTFKASDKPTTWFWSTGDAWGTIAQKRTRTGTSAKLTVLGGKLKLARLNLTGAGAAKLERSRTLKRGQSVSLTAKA